MNVTTYKIGNKSIFEIDTPKKEIESSGLHQIFIVDRSGSMGWSLEKVIDDLKDCVRKLNRGDAVTFGWFSSQRMYKFPIKCFKIDGKESRQQLNKLFDEQKDALSLTCFSEILTELIDVLDEIEFLGYRKSVMFFSDGYANDPSIYSERESVEILMSSIRPKIDNFLSVAYTDYSDKNLLQKMAEIAGGRMVHNSELSEFSKTVREFTRESALVEPRSLLDLDWLKLDEDKDFGFTIDSKSSSVKQFEIDTKIPYNPGEKIYLFSHSPVYAFVRLDLPKAVAYASALCLMKQGNTKLAGDIISGIGDKFVLDRIYNSFTPTEQGRTEKFIEECVFRSTSRMLQGCYPECAPKKDEFCLLDVIDGFNKDDSLRVYTRHPQFNYRRIGRKSIYPEGIPKFIPNPNTSSPLSGIVWHKKYLNLSIRVKTDGYVSVPEESILSDGTVLKRPESLMPDVETFQWRTYNLVKDGFLHTTQLPISSNRNLFDQFKLHGLVDDDIDWEDGKVYVLYLDRVPVINRQIAEQEYLIKEFCEKIYLETYTTLQLKVLNSLRKELDPDKQVLNMFSKFNESERNFLISLGFRDDGSYSPSLKREDPTDYYESTAFITKVAGFSSVPSLKAVRDRRQKIIEFSGTGREPKFTAPMRIMNEELTRIENKISHLSKSDKLIEIDSQIKALKWSLARIRLKIQRPKFAMVVGGNFRKLGDSETAIVTEQGEVEVLFETKLEKIKI